MNPPAELRPARISATSPAVPRAKARTLPVVPRWKRSLDITLIIVAAPMVAPVMAIIAMLIKLVSKGPLLFRQQRIGLGGTLFDCLKFRTMHAGASTTVHERHLADLMLSNQPMSKLDGHDPRLIPLARLLRATGMDELPQLFNVWRGEMSLVGPRPCTPNEYAAYSPLQRNRSGALPGLTGLWQVSGKNRTTFGEMIELDLRYIQTHCLWLDLGIVLRTPMVLVTEAISLVRLRDALGPIANRMGLGAEVPLTATASPQPLRSADHQPRSTSFNRRATRRLREGARRAGTPTPHLHPRA